MEKFFCCGGCNNNITLLTVCQQFSQVFETKGGIWVKKANIDAREAMKEKHIPTWGVALVLGVHENTVLRRIRTELSSENKQNYIRIIDELAKENTPINN